MYRPARIRRLLKKLLRVLYTIFVRMCSSGEKPKGYAFRAFRFETLKPPSSSSMWPYPRSGHRIGADSANFYSFGGYNPRATRVDYLQVEADEDEEYGFLDEDWIHTYPLFQELWKFNYASKTWTKFDNSDTLPMELASNALVLHKNILMVYGGTGSPFGFTTSNQLFICKVNEKNGLMVEVDTKGPHPLPLYGQALVFHNDYLYTIGGTTGQSYTCDIHRLNIKSMTWEVVYICNGQGEYEPRGRYRHEVGFDGRNIYVLGGGTIEETYGFRYLPAFDTEKFVWWKQKTIKDPNKGYPRARRCHGAVQVGGPSSNSSSTDVAPQVFVVGGHDGEDIFDDLWRLDLTTFRWTCFDSCRLPRPMYFHAAAVSPEGRLFVFGGNYSVNDNVKRSSSIYSTWLCVPKLSEICWEAVLHYSPHLNKSKSEDMINIGLPRHLVQRLGSNNNMYK